MRYNDNRRFKTIIFSKDGEGGLCMEKARFCSWMMKKV